MSQSPDSSESKKSFRSGILPVSAALVAITILVYIPALDAGFIWDDDFYVTENPVIRDLQGLKSIWTDITATPQYYPLTHTSFWVQYQFWEQDPFHYHLWNVLLHAISAVLLFLVLRRLELPGAWLAAALFAVHPVHVESVAWITERKNVISAVFYLAAALAYLRFSLGPAGKPAGGAPSWRCGIAAGLLYLAALLGKTVTASLPVVLAMVVWWKRGKIALHDRLVLGAMLLAGAGMGMLTASLERTHVLAEGPWWDFSLVERCLIAGRAVWFYLFKLLWPAELIFNYPRWDIDTAAAWQYLFPVSLAALVVVLLFLRRKTGSGPMVALACFIVSLAPALGFFNVYPMLFSFVADHFQYLASIGPLAVAAVLLWRWLPSTAVAGRLRIGRGPARMVVPGLVLLTLGVLTFIQAGAYKDQETLWRHTIERNSGSWLAHLNLGKLLESEGRVDEAIDEYQLAIEACQIPLETAHFRLGKLYTTRGRLREAAQQYRLAVEAGPGNPENHVNLANILADQGDFDAAEKQYRKALEIVPEHDLARYNLAVVLEQTGRAGEAEEQYMLAVRFNPEFAPAYNNLAILLFRSGRMEEARDAAGKCMEHGGRLHPGFMEALFGAQAGTLDSPE